MDFSMCVKPFAILVTLVVLTLPFNSSGFLTPSGAQFGQQSKQRGVTTTKSNNNNNEWSPLSASNQDMEEGDDNSRRGFVKKLVGGLAVSAIVSNGISVQGPSPTQVLPGSMNGKTVVITGGNTGLGLESAKRLAIAGATIVITSRNLEKGNKAVKIIKNYAISNDQIYAVPLDLCDLKSVKAFPSALKQVLKTSSNNKRGAVVVDVLLNNAGVMAVPELEITKDGYEKTFQTNHLGHFALTAGMMPLMNPEGSRVINVSSAAYFIASKGLDMSNLNGEQGYQPWQAYGMSKLENIYFTQELQRRCDAAGINLTTASLHPGAVRTDLPRYIVGEDKYVSMVDTPDASSSKPSILTTLGLYAGLYFSKSVDRGANSQIWLASRSGDKDVGGKYYQNMKEVKLADFAKDSNKARELWEVSEKLSGVKFNLQKKGTK
mmetsp:Transcript_20452/g.19672  ORF Transcript_20452/g.19672 Transcript_20452/m.19672 type:complete len:434 (-) Transcript_20452:192-1493(-)|eukprot:CAMPEP_0197835726 /NCGR_PEP_ID=MMETSP1437-20131217/26765_1 /TAXON_ID=49252 ORGANISM="Eucampia antarctica, Strain CCMP1452" /NCGR_SAMPLE_ID=MMETSP1437 /ASSEMBLY_ACC=CAM_ASM_001096 /LENGTH=433 /DNA_ID=CAMNT_0043441377 /DNA_START=33 /DNA_END=1334 /DNA_ORIENTATION=+